MADHLNHPARRKAFRHGMVWASVLMSMGTVLVMAGLYALMGIPIVYVIGGVTLFIIGLLAGNDTNKKYGGRS